MRKWLPLVLIAFQFLFTALVYDRLPARMATHFGTEGPNGWSGRFAGAWIVPAITLGLWLLLRFVPRIDPRGINYARFWETYETIILAVVALMVVVHVSLLGYALGWPVRVETVVPLAVGALMILIGNLMPRLKSTWFVGIRTPWTLTNDVVWEKTHRVGGYLFTAAGLLLMTLSFLRSRAATYTVIAAMLVLCLSTIPYSYFVWRKIAGPYTPPPPPPPPADA
jgi:uncharacterized membrane protein